jgi:hypothetical protein
MASTQESVEKKVRVSLDLTVPFYERLDALEKATSAESKAGVIRQALQVYEYIARKTLEGYTFRAVDADGKEETLVFFGGHHPYVEQTRVNRRVVQS